MPTTKRAKSAPPPAVAPTLPPFLTSQLIETDYLRGVIARDRLRLVLAHPSAPRPVLGGVKGATPIYSRHQIVEFFERISREGCWPTSEGVAA